MVQNLLAKVFATGDDDDLGQIRSRRPYRLSELTPGHACLILVGDVDHEGFLDDFELIIPRRDGGGWDDDERRETRKTLGPLEKD